MLCCEGSSSEKPGVRANTTRRFPGRISTLFTGDGPEGAIEFV